MYFNWGKPDEYVKRDKTSNTEPSKKVASGDNDSDLYSRGAQFESRLWHMQILKGVGFFLLLFC